MWNNEPITSKTTQRKKNHLEGFHGLNGNIYRKNLYKNMPIKNIISKQVIQMAQRKG